MMMMCVNSWMVWVNEVPFVHNHTVSIYAVANLINVGIRCPPVGYDMATG